MQTTRSDTLTVLDELLAEKDAEIDRLEALIREEKESRRVLKRERDRLAGRVEPARHPALPPSVPVVQMPVEPPTPGIEYQFRRNEPALPDRIDTVLRRVGHPMTSPQLAEVLKAEGVKTTSPKGLSGMISSALTRRDRSGKVRFVRLKRGLYALPEWLKPDTSNDFNNSATSTSSEPVDVVEEQELEMVGA